jgi:hypothetical protein
MDQVEIRLCRHRGGNKKWLLWIEDTVACVAAFVDIGPHGLTPVEYTRNWAVFWP